MNYQAMVGVLREVGVEVRDQPVLPSALGLPDGARTRLLVDHDGLFRVYCAENLSSSLPMSGIKGALKKSGDVALLLVNRGEGRFVALLAAVDGEIHQEDLNEAQVLRLLPNVRAVGDEDPYAVSDRVRELILHPEEEWEAYQNKGLFSDDYLEYRLTDSGQYPEWAEDVSRAREKLRGLYDEESGEILESHLGIYKRIRCGRETPRVDSGHDVHSALAEVKESLLVDLNARIGASAAPTQLFKEQRDALAILRGNLNHATVAREDSVELTKVVRRPLARTLRRELRDMLDAYEGSEDYGTLVSELQSFVGRYGLDDTAPGAPSENGSSGEKEIEEEELELVAYLDLS